jgi:hypothetical protein
MNKMLKATLTIACIALPLQIYATPVAILNAGFEAPVTSITASPPDNWTVIGGGLQAGVWNIVDYAPQYWTATPGQEGKQVAYLSLGPVPGVPSGLSQILGDSLVANTIYTLSGLVGHPDGILAGVGQNFQAGTTWTASLYAGGNLLNSTSGTGPAGSLAAFSLNFNSTGSAFVGQLLEIRLESDRAQTAFDAIALNAQGVPDGGLTILLLGMSMTGLGWMRRKMR